MNFILRRSVPERRFRQFCIQKRRFDKESVDVCGTIEQIEPTFRLQFKSGQHQLSPFCSSSHLEIREDVLAVQIDIPGNWFFGDISELQVPGENSFPETRTRYRRRHHRQERRIQKRHLERRTITRACHVDVHIAFHFNEWLPVRPLAFPCKNNVQGLARRYFVDFDVSKRT